MHILTGAPKVQSMSASIEKTNGVVIRQQSQLANAVGIPCYVQEFIYEAWQLPRNVHAAQDPRDRAWVPDSAFYRRGPPLVTVAEESECLTRSCLSYVGCASNRPMSLHFLQGNREIARAERAFRLGGAACCPLEMTVFRGNRVIGRVVEDFDIYPIACCRTACQSIVTHKVVTSSGEHLYSLRTGTSCCGRVNNICGATCCFPTLIMDIVDGRTGRLRSTVQKTFGARTMDALFRAAFNFDTYVAEFPKDAGEDEKILLTAAVVSQDLAIFSHASNGNGGR